MLEHTSKKPGANFVAISSVAALGLFTAHANAAVSTYVFTGPTTLSTPVVTTTTETPAVTVVAPALVTPETDPGRVVDLDDGFGIYGRFDFINGTGTAAEISFAASRPLNLVGGTTTLFNLTDVFLAIDSADFTSPIPSGSGFPLAGTLSAFSVNTSLLSGNTLVLGNNYGDNVGRTVPLEPTNFPGGALEESNAGSLGAQVVLSSASLTLSQTVTMDFTDLVPGEAVDIDLPTFATINSSAVPEPASLGVLAILGTAAFKRRR